ncbi:MAG: CDP-glycerol glycerophosphotransferase family protein, partial [Aeriscardovia sp.]|nr:CDP-glycerol glycerophosphotransferase family protein [Aeriscardovia sp.]
FLVVYHQTWKYDGVYELMRNSPLFSPVLLICPIMEFGREKMLQFLKEDYDFFCARHYDVILSYDGNTYIDLIKDINPDIIFYTNPYEGLIDNRYYITNFLDRLTVYVPYAFNNNIDLNFCHNLPLHNMVWRYYSESEEHRSYSRKISFSKGRNVVVTGYPGIEHLIKRKTLHDCKDWKIKDNHIKRIIWAPHHTIGSKESVVYSCFLRYAEFMLDIADKYKNDVQFVFKPHPMLKSKLDNLWGEDKANYYYDQWKSRDNCNYNNGEYTDLFHTSDAMIHDSGSFLTEYLYVNKPVMRTLNDIPLKDQYNSFALKCLDQYYMAHNEQDIEQFIQNVINEVDPLKEQRTKFVNEVLMPKGSPSKNIIDDILDSIDNQTLYRD